LVNGPRQVDCIEIIENDRRIEINGAEGTKKPWVISGLFKKTTPIEFGDPKARALQRLAILVLSGIARQQFG